MLDDDYREVDFENQICSLAASAMPKMADLLLASPLRNGLMGVFK